MAVLKVHKGKFIVKTASPEEGRALKLKDNGFRWHPAYSDSCYTMKNRGSCELCKDPAFAGVWLTDNPVAAMPYARFADEEAKKILDERKKLEAASRAVATEESFPRPEGLNYLPYQKAGIAFALRVPGALIADEMGLGKTIQAIGVINADPSIKRVLILCPALLRRNWERELRKWLTREMKIQVIMERDLPSPDAEIVVVNYDKLVGKLGDPLVAALKRTQWDLLVADEAHVLKNYKAARTIAVVGSEREGIVGIDKSARRKIYLTGTPLLNRPIELWTLIHSLNPSEFNNWWHFARRYAGAVRGEYGIDVSGATNLEELQDRLRQSVMIRRRKADVLKELPPKRRYLVELDYEGNREVERALKAEKQAYDEMEDELARLRAKAELAKLDENEAAYKEAVKNLQEVGRVAFSKISKVRHEVAVLKIPFVIGHLGEMLEEGIEKIIVFAHHHDVVHALRDHFSNQAVVLTGETPPEEKDRAVQAFQTAKNVKLFIGSIRAAGVGITLTASSNVVFAELDWVPAMITQAEDRAHRIGQPSSVTVQHLVFNGSLDARIAKTLIEKQEIYEKVLDLPTSRPELATPVLASEPKEEAPEKETKNISVSPELTRAVHQALKFLASQCDGAIQLDGFGFNRVDAYIGRSLAEAPSLTPKQTLYGRKIVLKYRRQLPEEIYSIVAAGGSAS